MAEGDIIYDHDQGWLIEGGEVVGFGPDKDMPLGESQDPFYKALWVILKQLPIPDGASDENIKAIFDAAVTGAEGAMGKPTFWDQLSPQIAWRDLDTTFTDADGFPDPIKKQNYIQEVYATAKLQGLIPKDAEPPKSGANEQIVAGEDYGGPPGSTFIRDSSGNLTPYTPPTQKKVYPGGVIRGEDIGGPPGSLFLQDPSGNLTPYTPPTPFTDAMSPRDAARLVADAVREVGSGGGGGITPEEAEQWIKALTSSSGQGAPSPGQEFGSLDAQARARGEVPGGLSQGFGGPTGPFGVPLAPGMGTDLSVSSIFADAAKVASFQGLTPEQYDPNYETASPEAQAAIRADLASKQMGVGASAQAAPAASPVAAGQTGSDVSQSPSFLDALRKRQNQLAGVGPSGKPLLTGGQGETDTFNAAMGGVSTPGPAGQIPATGFSAFPAGSAQNMGDVLKQAQAGDVAGARQNAQGLVAQGFAARAGAGGASPGAGPGAPPMTFEQALFQINERVRQERQKQKSLRDTGRTVFR